MTSTFELNSSIFLPVRTVVHRRETKAYVEDAVAAVQNPSLMIHLNPLVESCVRDENDSQLWHITDRFSMLGFSTRIKYSAKFENLKDGVQVSSSAGFGTTLQSRWKVQPISPGGQVEIIEEVKVKVCFQDTCYKSRKCDRPFSRLCLSLLAR